jgi:septal ring factor EnvC (AmiA/AmiB activator)
MPEWSGHWIVDSGLAAFCALFAIYANSRWRKDDQERDERKQEREERKQENDRYNRRHEKTEDRMTAMEKQHVDLTRWLTQIELDRNRVEAEKLTRLANIEKKLDRLQDRNTRRDEE